MTEVEELNLEECEIDQLEVKTIMILSQLKNLRILNLSYIFILFSFLLFYPELIIIFLFLFSSQTQQIDCSPSRNNRTLYFERT